MNAGHSLLHFLHHVPPTTTLITFDMGYHYYTTIATSFFHQYYHHYTTLVVLGDSGRSVPDFMAVNPQFRCDLMFIDGGHGYEVSGGGGGGIGGGGGGGRHRIDAVKISHLL